MSQMLKSSAAMAGATMFSRVLGLVREQAYAQFMGDTAVASAFKFAYQVPNLFRRLLGEGALTAAFVPIFKRKEQTEGEEAMWEAANATMSGVIVATALITGLVMVGVSVVLSLSHVTYTQGGKAVFPPYPIPILNPDTRLMLELLRLMFPYLMLVCLAALCMGMLNARGYFFLPALGATLLNVVMIVTVFFIAPRCGQTLREQIFALGVAVLVAGAAQFLFQVPVLRRQGWRYRWVTPWGNPTVREVVRKMIPGTLGVAAFQLNVLIIQSVAFSVDRTIVASFDYAVRLMEFPQGVFGISLATYMLPTLAGLAAEKRYDGFKQTLNEGIGFLLFMNLLAAAMLLALAQPVVRLIFERGAFTPDSTRRAAAALLCLAPGLAAFSTVNVLARAFYALGDTKTPMMISAFCLGLNVVISLWLIGPLKQAGLGAANTTTSFVHMWLLFRALGKKLKTYEVRPLLRPALTMAAAAAAAGLTAWGADALWTAHLGRSNLLLRAGEVAGPGAAGAAVYFLVAWALRLPQLGQLIAMLRRGK